MTSLLRYHENPEIIARAETLTGRCAIWLFAGALLLWHSAYGPGTAGGELLYLMIWLVPLTTVFASHRRLVLSWGTVLMVAEVFRQRNLPRFEFLAPETWSAYDFEWLRFAALAVATPLVLVTLFGILRRFSSLPRPIAKFPIVTFHLGIWAAIFTVPVLPMLGVVTEVLPYIAWRVSYLIQFAQRGELKHARLRDHLFYLWPAYGPNGVPTPLGKGLQYLSRHEAKNATELAKSQLAGIKLLILAACWEVVLVLMDGFAYGDPQGPMANWFNVPNMGLPRPHEMMDSNVTDLPVVVVNLYLQLISMSLNIAIFGHIVVGCIRLLGFQVFRHTYRPLFATSIVDFWGRWSYYYKEMLTDFFFFPTFLRCSWAGTKLRLFLAVFAAAAVGNMYYEVLWNAHFLLDGDWTVIRTGWGSRSVYCILLAAGIWVSMIRQQKMRKGQAAALGVWSRIRKAFLVCSFYSIVHIWALMQSTLGPLDRLLWLLRTIS